MTTTAAEDAPMGDFVRRFLSASELVRGVVTMHALAEDMPRMFPPDKLFTLNYRQYSLPLRNRHQKPELDWLLERLFAPERKWVLKQPFSARLAEKAGAWIGL